MHVLSNCPSPPASSASQKEGHPPPSHQYIFTAEEQRIKDAPASCLPHKATFIFPLQHKSSSSSKEPNKTHRVRDEHPLEKPVRAQMDRGVLLMILLAAAAMLLCLPLVLPPLPPPPAFLLFVPVVMMLLLFSLALLPSTNCECPSQYQ